MRKPVIALFMGIIAILLCVSPVAAEVGDSGYFGMTTSTTTVAGAVGKWFASPFALTVDANVTEMHIHADGYGYDVRFFIYSMDGATFYYGSDAVDCAGASSVWHNITGVNTLLVAGTYLLGVRTSGAASLHCSVGNGQNGTVGFNDAWGALSGVNTNQMLEIYANYTEAVVDTSEVTSQMISTDWLTFGGLTFLSILGVIFVLKSRNYLLNFIFGAVTFGAAAYLLGTDMILSGWINLLAILIGVICMADAIVIWRAS